jgi:hypothetical protein
LDSAYQLEVTLLRVKVLKLNLDRRVVFVHRDLTNMAILLHDAASFAESQDVAIAAEDDEPA